MPVSIREDDLRGPEVAALLGAHLDQMADQSPPESRHALDLDGLRVPDVTRAMARLSPCIRLPPIAAAASAQRS